MRIQHNITAMNSYRNFTANNSGLSKNLEKLSSGYKINRAGDDAAGLAISEKMRAQITGIEGATKNSKDGISLIQTAEGALTEVHSMLNRMTTLAEQSANGTYDNEVDRTQLQKEVESLKSEIDRVADSTNYNGIKLLDGSLAGTVADKVSTISSPTFDGMTLDATKARSIVKFNTTAAMGTGNSSLTAAVKKGLSLSTNPTTAEQFSKALDGAKLTLNVGLSDGTTRDVTINLVRNSDNKIEFQTNDGKTLKTIDSPHNTSAADLKTAMQESFRLAIKDDEVLNANFQAKIPTDDTEGTDAKNNLLLEARNAGSDGMTVTSLELTADKGSSKVETEDIAQLFTASNKLTTDYDQTSAIKKENQISPKVTKGTDAVTAFKAEDIVLYNDNYVDNEDGHKGNADKAVFEVNGKKFAIGLANQTTKNLGDDVTFISVTKASTTVAGSANESDANFGVAIAKEMKGTNGLSSTGTTTEITGIELDAKALNHIASEIAKQTGVEVNYNKTDYKIPDASTGTGSTYDDGEKLTASASLGNGTTAGDIVPVFTIGKIKGTEGKELELQIGDTAEKFNKMSVQIADMHTTALGIDKIDISTQEGATDAMAKIKAAINSVSDTRGGLGALQNRLDHTINNLGVMRENIQNAESLIRDTDVAEEMMTYTKNSILNQSAQAMLAQANQLPQGVLQLLG